MSAEEAFREWWNARQEERRLRRAVSEQRRLERQHVSIHSNPRLIAADAKRARKKALRLAARSPGEGSETRDAD